MNKILIIIIGVLFTQNLSAVTFIYSEESGKSFIHKDSLKSIKKYAKTETVSINNRPMKLSWVCWGLWDFSENKSQFDGAKFIKMSKGTGNKGHVLPKKLTFFNLNDKYKPEEIASIVNFINKEC